MKKAQNQKKVRSAKLHSRIAMLTEDDSKALLIKSLKDSLVLYILASSKIPVSTLMKELSSIELEVGEIVSSVIADKNSKARISENFRGFLCGSVSVILMSASLGAVGNMQSQFKQNPP